MSYLTAISYYNTIENSRLDFNNSSEPTWEGADLPDYTIAVCYLCPSDF